jgi:hypothetical protein
MTTDYDAFVHFQTAAADAPEGTFEDVKALRQAIGEAVDGFMRTLRTEHGRAVDCKSVSRRARKGPNHAIHALIGASAKRIVYL